MRQHMTDDGPKDCNAKSTERCPLKDSDGMPVEHFDNVVQANTRWAEILEESHQNTVHSGLKKGKKGKAIAKTDSSIVMKKSKSADPNFVKNNLITGKTVSGHIDSDSLTQDSYKEFGFNSWTSESLGEAIEDHFAGNRTVYNDEMDGMFSNYISKEEIENLSPYEKNILFYYTQDGNWVNDALYDSKEYAFTENQKSLTEIMERKESSTEEYQDLSFSVPKTRANFNVLLKSLDTSLNHGISQQRIVYRGASYDMRKSEDQQNLEQWIGQERSIGTVVEYKGYTSTSYSLDIAAKFGTITDNTTSKGKQSQKLIYEILSPKGVAMNEISQFTDEEEVLLPRNQRYVVVGYHKCPEVEMYDEDENRFEIDFHVIQMVAVNDNNDVLDGTN